MATVTFDQATRIYRDGDRPAVDRLDLEIADGEFLVLVGPSGCGKSTTLRMLAGLEPIDFGEVYIGDRDVTMVPPKDRDIAMVFQSYALYPHMTVAENIGFHLKIKKIEPEERAKRVAEAAEILDLTDYLDRKPAKLSGGQRQRVRDGARDRARAAGVPDGRAAVEPRRQAPCPDPHADRRCSSADSASPPCMSPTTRSRR